MSAIAISCLQIPSSPLKLAMTAVVVTAFLVSVSKLPIFYTQNVNKLKDFGTAPEETIFPAWLAMVAVGYTVYIMAATVFAFERNR